MKKWADWLVDFVAGILTKQDLSRAGADADAITGAVTTSLELPSGYDRVAQEEGQRQAAVDFMRSQLGKRYQLGVEVAPGHESEASSWDCSEETEAAARVARWDPPLPDGAQAQYDFCRPVRSAEAGDLGFIWSEDRGCIGHVMMATGQGTVIHAVGGRGVVEDDLQRWESHPRWRGWRRAPGFMRPPEDRA